MGTAAVGDEEKVLELDGGNCMTIETHLMPQHIFNAI